MKTFLDTSVLIPAFLQDHQHHGPSIALFSSLENPAGCTAAHCLAEFYSSATRMPGKYRASPHQALSFLNDIRERLTLVALDIDEYVDVLDDASQAGIVGGAIYDSLVGKCAMKARAEAIYTWNVRHFLRLGPEIASRVREPGTS